MLKIALLSTLLFVSLSANYSLIYKNMNLGHIETFDTLKKGYLVSMVTNYIAYAMIGFNDNFVYYEENSKPNIESSKFKKDKKGLIKILLNSFDKPPYMKTIIDDDKYIEMKCTNSECLWDYYKKNEKYRSGKILFDSTGFIMFESPDDGLKIIKQKKD